MSEKSCFRGPFDKWHCKRDETLLKSEWELLYHISWYLSRQFSRKNPFLVVCKILRPFFNPLTADGKYSLPNGETLYQHFQMQLAKKRKTFSQFLFHFLNLYSILKIFKKKITLRADGFLNYRTPKNMVR